MRKTHARKPHDYAVLNVRIAWEAQTELRLICALTGEHQPQVLQRLMHAEVTRLVPDTATVEALTKTATAMADIKAHWAHLVAQAEAKQLVQRSTQ